MREPQQHTFDTLWGLERQSAWLLRLLAAGRLPSVILLEGPDALGKRSWAFAAAKVILSATKRGGPVVLNAPSPASAKRSIPPPPPEDSEPDLFGFTQAPEPEPDLFDAPPVPAPSEPEPIAIAEPPPAPEPESFFGEELPEEAAPAVATKAYPFLGLDAAVCRKVESSYPVKYDSDGIPTVLGHPDLTILEPPGNSRSILVSQIHALHQMVALPPIQCEYRVVLIFGADTITSFAANSMLKLLEEPPSYLRFIMVTGHPNRVMRTIRSRSSRVPFYPMTRAALVDALVEKEGVRHSLAEVLAAFAEGRPGMALRAIGTSLLAKRRELFEARLLPERYGPAAVPAAAHRAAQASGGDLNDTARLLFSFLRDRLVARHAPDNPELLVNGDLQELLAAGSADDGELDEELDRILALYDALRHPFLPNAHAALELALWPSA